MHFWRPLETLDRWEHGQGPQRPYPGYLVDSGQAWTQCGSRAVVRFPLAPGPYSHDDTGRTSPCPPGSRRVDPGGSRLDLHHDLFSAGRAPRSGASSQCKVCRFWGPWTAHLAGFPSFRRHTLRVFDTFHDQPCSHSRVQAHTMRVSETSTRTPCSRTAPIRAYLAGSLDQRETSRLEAWQPR